MARRNCKASARPGDREFRAFMNTLVNAPPVNALSDEAADDPPNERELQLVHDWRALPANERAQFKRAIAERAAVWRDPATAHEPTIVVNMIPLADT
jgi:hypothetical protein